MGALFVRVCLVLVGLVLCLPLPSRAEGVPCPAVKLVPLALSRVKQTLAQKQELTVVALGSSSTAGAKASDVAHTYPAILQTELEKALPASHIAVLNRGIGGQDAA